jgi:hypothetical protein
VTVDEITRGQIEKTLVRATKRYKAQLKGCRYEDGRPDYHKMSALLYAIADTSGRRFTPDEVQEVVEDMVKV